MKRTSLLLVAILFFNIGCVAKVPKDALLLPKESLANRQLQTRIYQTGNEQAVLTASNAVLQDLGFNLDESSMELGVLVASKDRDATDTGQLVGLTILAILGNNPNAINAADATQLVKVSVVVRPLSKEKTKESTKLTPAKIAQVKQEVYSVFYKGLQEHFPKETCDRIASQMAKNTADTLANDLETLLSVKELEGTTAVRATFQQVVFNKLGQINSQQQINDPEIYTEFFEKLSKSLFLEANQI